MNEDSWLYEVEDFRADMEDHVAEMDCQNGLTFGTPEEVLNYVKEYIVASIRIWFIDMV